VLATTLGLTIVAKGAGASMARIGTYLGGSTIFAPRRRPKPNGPKLPKGVKAKIVEPVPARPGPKWEMKPRKRKGKPIQVAPGKPTTRSSGLVSEIPSVRGRPASEYEVALWHYAKACDLADKSGASRPEAPLIVSAKLGGRFAQVMKTMIRSVNRKGGTG
jgi:hypothetical protein